MRTAIIIFILLITSNCWAQFPTAAMNTPAASGATILHRSLTIDHTQCGSSNSTNMPIQVTLSHTTLKTVANGGHVANSNGYDIMFFSDMACTTPLVWSMVSYDGTAGTMTAKIKIPTVDHSTDVVFYVEYGDATKVTYQSTPANVYTNGYLAVWYFNDNAGNTTVTDVLGTTNGVLTANTSTKTTTGKNFPALSFSGSDHVRLSSAFSSYSGSVNTLSMWMKISAYSTFGVVTMSTTTGSTVYNQIASNTSVYTANTAMTPSGITMDNNTWLKADFVSDNSNVYFYLNGVQKGTTASGGTAYSSGGKSIDLLDWIGGESSSYAMKGSVNDVELSSVVRSADWCLTSSNNQSNPGNVGSPGFITVGSEF